MELMILGCRGIPARHGGFETFAQDLSLYLVSRGHKVSVFCQVEEGETSSEDMWEGIHLVKIPAGHGPMGTIQFDWASTVEASKRGGLVLTLGYNTALLSYAYRLLGVPNVMNMDGIEWKRAKWSRGQRAWLWFNEWAGAKLANHLVADHPEIARHLQRHSPAARITTIPYGAEAVFAAGTGALEQFGLVRKGYYTLIARPEPENSIIEIVQAHRESCVESMLVILGDYEKKPTDYMRAVQEAAGGNARFVGAIYDRKIISELRFHSRGYLHGHRVGGTNPSLVEALAAGNAIVAHDNRFSRWVAQDAALYFDGVEKLCGIFQVLERDAQKAEELEANSRKRHLEAFTQEKVLSAYETLLTRFAR